ncbi:MAG: CAP domain-containing protein [Bacilli bacterium]|nr:CAP domain-containing protein [Bacilli bacterium]
MKGISLFAGITMIVIATTATANAQTFYRSRCYFAPCRGYCCKQQPQKPKECPTCGPAIPTPTPEEIESINDIPEAPVEIADSVPTLAGTEVESFAERAVKRINNFRSRWGLPPLELDKELCRACDAHSVWMGNYGFQHDPRGGAEVIAVGVGTPESAVDMWFNSPPHAAILSMRAKRIGVGNWGTFWTARVR